MKSGGCARQGGRWQYRDRYGDLWSERALIAGGRKINEVKWDPRLRAEKVRDKARYVTFEGDKRERRELRRTLKHPVLAYPKR